MKRYAIISHHVDEQHLRLEEGKIVGQQPVHDLVSNYHWFRLDDEHIMMLANYPASSHSHLHSHDKVSMMSHAGSNRSVHAHFHKHIKHCNKDKHWCALKNHLDIDESHTMEDVIDLVVAKHGPIFAVHS